MAETPSPNPSRRPSPSSKSSGSSSSSKQRRRHPAGKKVRKAASPEESQLQQWQLAKHESRRKKRGKSKEFGQLNLTSMIDVIFLLLIYFVITASFVEDEGVLIAKLPSGSGPAKAEDLPPQNIEIFLQSHNATEYRLTVGTTPIDTFKELTGFLKKIQNNPAKGRTGYADIDSPVIIKPNGDVKWEHVVSAFNSSISSGYTSVSFAQASN